VDLIVGARPNFVKVAPVFHAFREQLPEVTLRIVHTGQHYDANMSDVFFKQLSIPEPDVFLGVGSGSHGAQTGAVIARYEEVLLRNPPRLTLVFGDVNSTMACAIAAVKLGVEVGHVEAGLRSFDRSMPEEINRIVTDHLADLLFTPSQDANDNLANEGIRSAKVHLVGNVMIDSLLASKNCIEESTVLDELGLKPKRYGVLTLHRPGNVDDDGKLRCFLDALSVLQERIPIIFPVHPRTRQRLPSSALAATVAKLQNVRFLAPCPYFAFMKLLGNATLVITDSGGIQEETTVLNVPCLTTRANTERPITVEYGTSVLVGSDTQRIVREAERILDGDRKIATTPPLWDGKTAQRIVAVVAAGLATNDSAISTAAHVR
jgi:UDP-N-acetylglucosamine 2-epimerase (non-hydrolysing)